MKTLAFILALAAAWPVVAQTTYKINQLTELAAAPADTDWLIIWDTSAATSKKISRANFLAGGIIPESFGLTDPGADRLLFWDESAGVYRHLTLGTGLSISDTTLNAEAASATVTLPAARIAYGAADNTLTSEAGFEYDATFNNLRVPTMVSIGATGSAFAMYTTGSGSLTMFNDFTDETLIWNLGVGGANTAFLSSDSGVTLLELTSIDLKVPTEVYDATGWNGDLTVPTKDAVRDKIEALSVGSTSLTATYVGYGDGSNAVTGEAAFAYNASTNTLTVETLAFTTLTGTTLNVTNLNTAAIVLKETSGAGSDNVSLYVSSTQTDNRNLSFAIPDANTTLTIPAAATTIVDTTATQTITGKTIATADNVLPAELIVAASDETTAITTGTGKLTFRMPYAMTLTAVRASVGTAPVGSTIIIDINEGGSTIMTTTKLSIDASEKTSTTAASAAALTDTALADDAEITIDFDQVGSSTAGAGVKVTFIGTK